MSKKKKKQRSKSYSTTSAAPSNEGSSASEPMDSRRDVLRKLRNGGIAVAVLGGGGWFAVRDVQATIHEHDLSRIGNGIPTVVQIHDPNCLLCTALQKEARAAMENFEESDLQFLVANIRDAKGKKLASQHGVGHVTLLLFDKDGKRREIMRGSNDRSVLEPAFRQFLAQSS